MQNGIKGVFVEVREKLRACQFYIRIDGAKHYNIDLSHQNIVKLIREGEIISILLPDTDIITNSLSGLVTCEDFISFRLCTHPKQSCGSYRSEVWTYQPDDGAPPRPTDCNIKSGTPLSVYCLQCRGLFKENMTFERVLPLPMSGLEGGEFFCHQSDNEKLKCAPKRNDCLFCEQLVCFNRSLIGEVKGPIVCPNCKSNLGYSDNEFCKLWISATVISDAEIPIFEDKSFEIFISLINKHIDLTPCSKILLYNPTDYDDGGNSMLIRVMDKNLTVLTLQEIKGDKVLLKEILLRKVLYKANLDSSDIEAAFKDLYTATVECSSNIIVFAVAYLKNMSNQLPDYCKQANNMLLSYVEIKTQVKK